MVCLLKTAYTKFHLDRYICPYRNVFPEAVFTRTMHVESQRLPSHHQVLLLWFQMLMCFTITTLFTSPSLVTLHPLVSEIAINVLPEVVLHCLLQCLPWCVH